MDETKKNRYMEALKIFKKYSTLQKGQKLRGLNDLNIFTTLLSKNDEVRLHSSFIHFLLDNKANHYQGALFLELFFNTCGIPEDFIDLESAEVFKEFQFIDLYITDGVNHIIIENKLQALDQPKQLERYIDVIKFLDTDGSSDICERLIIIYLSLGRSPADHSMGRFQIEEDRLVSIDESYRYFKITYEEEIINWIEESLRQVSNITNLSVILSQYRDVLKKIYGNYRGNVMSLYEFIESHPDKTELYKTFGEIASEYKKLKFSIMQNFWDLFMTNLTHEAEKRSWLIECSDLNRLEIGKKFGYPLRVKWQQTDNFCFAFEYHDPDYGKPMWGIWSAKDNDILSSKNNSDEEFMSLPDTLDRESSFWPKHRFYINGDFFEWVMQQESISTAANVFFNDFMTDCLPCMDFIKSIKGHSLLSDNYGGRSSGNYLGRLI